MASSRRRVAINKISGYNRYHFEGYKAAGKISLHHVEAFFTSTSHPNQTKHHVKKRIKHWVLRCPDKVIHDPKKMDSVPTEKNTQNYTCTSNCISCSASITPLVFQLPVLYPTLDPWPIMAHHGPWHLDEGPFRLQQIRQVKERRDGTPMLRPQLRLFRCQGCTVKLFGLAGCRGTFKTSRFHLAYTLILLTFTISMCIYICNIH